MYKTVALLLCVLFVTTALGTSLGKLTHLRTRSILSKARIPRNADTGITEFPYLVQVEFYIYLLCTGTILSEKFVLTSARCTLGFSISFMEVRYGTSELNKGGTPTLVSTIFRHPLFNYRNFDYDVSVLEVMRPIQFSAIAQPIALSSREPVRGDKALVSGWGSFYEDFEENYLPPELRSVEVPVVDRDECNKVYEHNVTKRMICAGDYKVECNQEPFCITHFGGVCYGDYGGPLLINDIQVGIASWGSTCGGEGGYPRVYSNVASFRTFIDKSTHGLAKWVPIKT